jgi:hypothetical protein
MKILELHIKATGKECCVNMDRITNFFENDLGEALVCFDDGNYVVVSEPYLFIKNSILYAFNPTL